MEEFVISRISVDEEVLVDRVENIFEFFEYSSLNSIFIPELNFIYTPYLSSLYINHSNTPHYYYYNNTNNFINRLPLSIPLDPPLPPAGSGSVSGGYVSVLWLRSSGDCEDLSSSVLGFYSLVPKLELVGYLVYGNNSGNLDVIMNLVKDKKHHDLEIFLTR